MNELKVNPIVPKLVPFDSITVGKMGKPVGFVDSEWHKQMEDEERRIAAFAIPSNVPTIEFTFVDRMFGCEKVTETIVLSKSYAQKGIMESPFDGVLRDPPKVGYHYLVSACTKEDYYWMYQEENRHISSTHSFYVSKEEFELFCDELRKHGLSDHIWSDKKDPCEKPMPVL